MATTIISAAARSAACNAVVDLIDAGNAAGTIKIYTGAQPAGPGTAPSGTLLATLTFSDPAFGSASSGVATASAITADSSADDTGTAGWARIADSDGTAILDVNVGATGSGATIEFDSVAFEAGGAVNITSMSFTVPSTYTV